MYLVSCFFQIKKAIPFGIAFWVFEEKIFYTSGAPSIISALANDSNFIKLALNF